MLKKPHVSQHLLETLSIKSHNQLGDDYRVMSRVPFTKFAVEVGIGDHSLNLDMLNDDEDIESFVIVDTKTTGECSETDEIIEIALLKGYYSTTTKRIVLLYDLVCFLEAPYAPLRPSTTVATGLTDEQLRNQQIDDATFERTMKDVSLVIAHNGSFDRKFIDNHRIGRFFIGKAWACTNAGGNIDWAAAGHRSNALDTLLADYGFFFDGHRASVNCVATAWLLIIAQAQFAELLDSVQREAFCLQAR